MADEATETGAGPAAVGTAAEEAVTPAPAETDGIGDTAEAASPAPTADEEPDGAPAATLTDLGRAHLAPAPAESSLDAAVVVVPEGLPAPAEQESEPSDAADGLDVVLLGIDRLHLRLDELSRLSQRQVGHIDQLHAENQHLRAGELRQAMAPLLRGLVRHHDNVAKMQESAEGTEARALRDVRAGLLSVLSIAGVEAFEAVPNEQFDAARHQGVSRIETDDVTLDGTVAQMRRCGFAADDGRIIRAADVEVYRAR